MNYTELRNTIHKQDARTGKFEPFKIRVVKCDVERGTGGQIIEVEGRLVKHRKTPFHLEVRDIEILKRDELTRKLLATKQTMRIHLRLITTINGIKIEW